MSITEAKNVTQITSYRIIQKSTIENGYIDATVARIISPKNFFTPHCGVNRQRSQGKETQ